LPPRRTLTTRKGRRSSTQRRAPDTIGRYLGVKWSDGSAFLVTWIGPDTRPIRPDFLDAYERRRTEPDALAMVRVRPVGAADSRDFTTHAVYDAMGRCQQAVYLAMNSVEACAA
jgi:hypothetical protein